MSERKTQVRIASTMPDSDGYVLTAHLHPAAQLVVVGVAKRGEEDREHPSAMITPAECRELARGLGLLADWLDGGGR